MVAIGLRTLRQCLVIFHGRQSGTRSSQSQNNMTYTPGPTYECHLSYNVSEK